jgi:sialate O-acetylesterase
VRTATIAASLLVGLIACPTSRADTTVKLHGLFTDHMVVQREMDAPVWGTATPGETVTVEFNGQKVQAKADDKGHWKATLKPMKAGGPHTLTATGDKNKESLEIKDVLVGEVWICSGQSNMEWSLIQTNDGFQTVANSKNPMIRLFDVPKKPNLMPQHELGTIPKVQKGRTFGKWLESNPENTSAFSGVGYYFGRALQNDLKVPVGLINSSWGGTAAERWLSKEVLESDPYTNGIKGDSRSDLYNGMIVPLEPFAFRGVIWYQGESNAGRAKQYVHLMSDLIKNWRDDWKQGDFPFLTVQLAPYDKIKVADQWPELREAQLYTSLKVKNTAMAVITDCGDPNDIHPKNKTPVGERLGLAARALAYGQMVEYIGPQFDAAKFEGDKAVVTFKHLGGGLVAKDGPLTGFTVAGKDGKFVKADATIVGSTVVVRSPEVLDPNAVRYAWANNPVVNLYNQEGLPATPFRSDVPDYFK